MQGLFKQSFWGVTTLSLNGQDFGYSADASLPLVPNQLEGYMEVGKDPFHIILATGGLHLPGLYRHTGIDVYVEYETRGGINDVMSLRLSANFARDWKAIAYYVQNLHSNAHLTGSAELDQEVSGKAEVGLAVTYRIHAR